MFLFIFEILSIWKRTNVNVHCSSVLVKTKFLKLFILKVGNIQRFEEKVWKICIPVYFFAFVKQFLQFIIFINLDSALIWTFIKYVKFSSIQILTCIYLKHETLLKYALWKFLYLQCLEMYLSMFQSEKTCNTSSRREICEYFHLQNYSEVIVVFIDATGCNKGILISNSHTDNSLHQFLPFFIQVGGAKGKSRESKWSSTAKECKIYSVFVSKTSH